MQEEDGGTLAFINDLNCETIGIHLARMTHALVHMHLLRGSETSEVIAQMLDTNPVVVRPTMSRLRDAGVVSSIGSGNRGWSLGRPPEEISLLDIHAALDGQVFSFGRSNDRPTCPVQQSVNGLLEHAIDRATRVLKEQLGAVSIAALAQRHQHRK